MKFNLASLTFLGLAILLFFSTACNTEEKHDGYTITGKVEGLDTALVQIVKIKWGTRGDKPELVDSVQMLNGAFEMKGKAEHADLVQLLIGSDYNGSFFLENSPISLEIDLGEADKYGGFEPIVSGSMYHDLYSAQMAKEESLYTQEKYAPLVKLREEGMKVYKSKDEELIKKFQEKQAQFKELTEERHSERINLKYEYVKNNPESPVSPYVMSFQFSEGRMTKEEMKEYYPVFQGEAKHTGMFKYFEKTYDEIFNSLGIGATAPDFELASLEGNNIKLSEVQGKYVLVDFWASWCVPCRASFPHLKELYTKYKKDGFEVLAIGTADEKEKWEKAIEEDQTPWKHIFDASKEDRKNAYGKVAKLYAVPFLPTTFLLDENQTIVLRNPKKEELDAKLAEVFGF